MCNSECWKSNNADVGQFVVSGTVNVLEHSVHHPIETEKHVKTLLKLEELFIHIDNYIASRSLFYFYSGDL